MVLAGLMLLIGSILKVHQLITEPVVSDGFWESWLFFVIQIPLELGLGIWLLSGLFRKACWLITVVCFAGFIAVILQKISAGATSCGCFGVVKVGPQITLFTIDVPLFVLLLIFRPKGCKLMPPPWPSAAHFFSVAIPTAIILPLVVIVLVFNKVEPVTIENVPDMIPPPPPVVLDWPPVVNAAHPKVDTPPDKTPIEPDQDQWDLLNLIDIADSLREGMAIILLYHSDCPDCRQAIPVYDENIREFGDQAIKLAFIEIPPYGPDADSPIPPDTAGLAGKLAELEAGKKWYIGTPYVIVTIDGVKIREWELETPDFDEIFDAFSN